MVIDFSKVDIRKRPAFILRNMDESAIANLGHMLGPTMKLCYNQVSELSFDYPASDNGKDLPEYDLLTGMRIVDAGVYGKFILRNPESTDDGSVRKKSCKAYSLEYEFSNETITLEEKQYWFWRITRSDYDDESILDIILSRMPLWKLGEVSQNLWNICRTVKVEDKNLYDFMMNDIQETYGCIFEFDTVHMTVNVRSTGDNTAVKSVYLSHKNLIKELEIRENTDDLVTVLDVFGADGVDIRSVNPTGGTRIYNLDAYMTPDYLPQGIISKWRQWKTAFENQQQPYYDLTIEKNMEITRLVTEMAVLAELQGELAVLEAQQSVTIQAKNKSLKTEADVREIYNRVEDFKRRQIAPQEELVKEVEQNVKALEEQQKSINASMSFERYFTEQEFSVLKRYFKCGSLTDSSFVASEVNTYSADSTTSRNISTAFQFSNASEVYDSRTSAGTRLYTVEGGTLIQSHEQFSIEGSVVRATLQVNTDSSVICSIYFSKGKLNRAEEFNTGTLSITGTLESGVQAGASTLNFSVRSASLCFSQEVSEYQRMAIEWDLYEYGKEFLEKASSPAYYFSLESINFLALDDFLTFAQQFRLGEKVYLHIDNQRILQPIAVSVSIDFDRLNNFKIEFSDCFHANDEFFSLEKLLDKSVSAGKALDFNQYNFNSFVQSGAHNSIRDFMTSALDAMKNRILAGTNEEITIDGTGIRCREYDPEHNTYDPRQLWITHNAIMFTRDNWQTGTIGIGEFVDKNLGSVYGVIAPAIVGTILAGEQLWIESSKTDGTVAVFKVNADGVSLHNASFNLYQATETNSPMISIDPILGIVGGKRRDEMFSYDAHGNPDGVKMSSGGSVTSVPLTGSDTPKANFWLDMQGNAYFNGKLISTSGKIGGFTITDCSLNTSGGNHYLELNSDLSDPYAIIAGSRTNPKFYVMKNGDMLAGKGKFAGELIGNLTNGGDGWIEGCGIKVGSSPNTKHGYSFYVAPDGTVEIDGSIHMSAGSSIDWNGDVGREFQESNVYNTMEKAWGNQCTDDKIFDILSKNGTKFGLFTGNDGQLYINAHYISSDLVKTESIELKNDYGGFTSAEGADSKGRTTKGAMIYGGSNGNIANYCVATTGGVRLQAGDFALIVTNTGVRIREGDEGDGEFVLTANDGHYSPENNDILSPSDRRLKNSIAYCKDTYDDFFRKLKPVAFKFSSGTSDRFHMGFIAQDVEDALLASGLTTQDFAGLVKMPDGELGEKYMLRYGEFVALNTHMIQKLLEKVKELELKILNLCNKTNNMEEK